MGLFNDAAYTAGKMAGLAKRKRDSVKRVNQQDAQTRAYVEKLHNEAQNGDIVAMFTLGCWYEEGSYVVLDIKKAQYWWTEAAKRGHATAQYNLGVLYLGDISPYYRDDNLAGYWFNAAANNGDRAAAEILREFKYSNFFKEWVRR